MCQGSLVTNVLLFQSACIESEWKTVGRSSQKTNDMIFSFDEDMLSENTAAPVQKKKSPRVRYTSKNRRASQSSRSVPERSAVPRPANRRARSSSTKSTVQHPSYALLERFSASGYDVYRSKCLNDRARCSVGHSKEMNTLYRFWSHYLRSNLDTSMYEEFKQFALVDAEEGSFYAMECLFRLFSYGLEKSLKQEMLDDFQSFVMKDLAYNRCYGLEKFWAFLKYRTYQTPIDIQPEISALLEKIRSLEDFAVIAAQLQGVNPSTSSAIAIKKVSPRRKTHGSWVRKY